MKINLICNDSLLPSTSDKNTAKNTEWVYDGSGAVSLYVNQKSLDILQDVSSTPKYIWLLESKQIIQGIYDWILTNYDFVASRVDGIFSCDKELCEKYPKFFYALSNAAPWIEERQIYEKTKLVSMISSNKAMVPGHRKRLEFVQKFRDQVDLYGRGFNDLPRKEEGIRDYMFSVQWRTPYMILILPRNLQTVSLQERFQSSMDVEESQNISTKMELYS